MEFRVLKYFLTVVREENITKAANVLHITQPTLSRQLAQLEEDIGVKLFNRGTRKISLTNEGMLLRRRAEEIISLVDKTEQELNEQDEMLDGVISLGCGELSSVSTLADILAGFKKKHPLIVYDLYTANADEIKEKIELLNEEQDHIDSKRESRVSMIIAVFGFVSIVAAALQILDYLSSGRGVMIGGFVGALVSIMCVSIWLILN